MIQNQKFNRFNRKRRFNAENGALFAARLAPKHIIDLSAHPIISACLEPGSITEIVGPCDSGKTSVLIDVAARCLLPASLGGQDARVVLIDCDRQFAVERLIAVLERSLAKGPSSNSNVADQLDECLRRFHYAACDNSQQLIGSFDSLDELIADSLSASSTSVSAKSTAAAAMTALGLATTPMDSAAWILLIDGINSFYWLDRSSRSRTSVIDMHHAYAARIQRFLNEHNLAALVSRLIVESGSFKEFGTFKDDEDKRKKAESSPPSGIAVSSLMDASWRKLITRTIQLAIKDDGRLTATSTDGGGESRSVRFQANLNGIRYL